MSYQPCRNPNCHSYGKPHPNCRCWGDLAEGGDVAFCSRARPHSRECEYFADGGDTLSGQEVPEDQVATDQPETAETVSGQEVPEDMVAPDTAESVSGQEVPQDQLSEEDQNQELSPHDLQAKMVAAARPEGVSKYETMPQQLAGMAEGVSRGVAGELSTLAENKVLGVPLEDIRGREEANPGEALGSEMVGLVGGLGTGYSEAALGVKGAKALAEYARLGKVGAGALKAFLPNFYQLGTDQVSKALLGENPGVPVGGLLATGLATVLGGVGGKLTPSSSSKLEAIAEQKFGAKMKGWLAGFGAAAQPDGDTLFGKTLHAVSDGAFEGKTPLFEMPKNKTIEAYEDGRKAYDALTDLAQGHAEPKSVVKEALKGLMYGGPKAAALNAGSTFVRNKALAKAVDIFQRGTSKVTPSVVLKILSSNTTAGMLDAMDYAEKIARNLEHVDNSVESIFRGGGFAAGKGIEKREQIEKWLEGGGADEEVQQEFYNQQEPEAAQGFAEGGHVSKVPKPVNGVATHFPEQNMLISAAKGRASNYLNSLRPGDPEHQPRLAFDDPPDDRQKKKAYDKALDVAASPLSVIDEIKKGTVEPEHIKHLNALFPELTGLLQQKITERITKAQLSGEKPNAKVRQGLSMLLGTPLSGELLPQNIQAAQAVFASGKQQAEKQAPSSSGGSPGTKKGTHSLSKSDRSYLTDDQARSQRQQRQT